MNSKKQNEIDNQIKINGPNPYVRCRILNILLSDRHIYELLGCVQNTTNEHLYWDDVDLVSDYYDNQTITSISSNQNQTIGDMKKDIIEFCANEKRKIEKHNNDINKTINDLEDIYENILSDVFYDMNWDDEQDEDEDKQNDMLISLQHAIDIIKKERK